MTDHKHDRRSFLKLLTATGATFVAGSFFKGTVAAAVEACEKVDAKQPAAMMVKALKYTPKSATKGQSCANCIQFKPDAKDKKVGTCAILQNCTVQPGAWCASWSKKG